MKSVRQPQQVQISRRTNQASVPIHRVEPEKVRPSSAKNQVIVENLKNQLFSDALIIDMTLGCGEELTYKWKNSLL